MKQDKIKVVLQAEGWFYILKTPTVPRVGDGVWMDNLDVNKMIIPCPRSDSEEHYNRWGADYKHSRDEFKCGIRFVVGDVVWGTTGDMHHEGYTKPMWICQGETIDRWTVNEKTGKKEALPEPQTHYDDIRKIANEIEKLSKKIDIIQSNQLK